MRFRGYEIVKYHPEFKTEVAEFQKILWGQDVALNEAYLEWKHQQNPYVSGPSIYLCLFDSRVIGMTSFTGAKWLTGNRSSTFLAPCAGDSALHPEHRGRGIFKEMNDLGLDDLARTGCDYALGLSSNAMSRMSRLMMGWQSAGSIETAWRQVDHAQSKNGRLHGLRRAARGIPGLQAVYRKLRESLKQPTSKPERIPWPFEALDRNVEKMRGRGNPNIQVEGRPRPDSMAELIQRVGASGGLQHVRDREFFEWRFKNPRSNYRFVFWGVDRLEGYLVLRASKTWNRSGVTIVDWEACNSLVRAALLSVAIQWGNFDNLTVWSESLSEEQRGLLHEAGFKFVKESGRFQEGPNVLVGSTRRGIPPSDWTVNGRHLLDLANWDLRPIYSDGM